MCLTRLETAPEDCHNTREILSCALIAFVISISKDCRVICDFDFVKVRSIIVVEDDMETVQWYSWVHKRPMRMVEEESLDTAEAVKSDPVGNWSVVCIECHCISQFRARPDHDMNVFFIDCCM